VQRCETAMDDLVRHRLETVGLTDRVNVLKLVSIKHLWADPRGCVWWKSNVQCGTERK
jgi:hypothetical protein